ncbi:MULTISPECIES: hypothetical protein [unclassified Paenibacillus]|uniref:hypothetical protein n=1 Tax=unclassified Paenibacillus TaxID=185978 RepID=UPI0024070AEB|nr:MULTISPECIES: hypothetical protein [unclassified Paenibacillus]MDF9845315.1 putative small secreted protein [Paenibacillus sp. PastF-2]MDF9851897.1 putative small secreted protein [Paenibacillus sp. PastM-2]MDF9858461.1 putative small secreted protein [Paenibacillus sp. PastF-1]MDH6483728.1 putative small secreted protein [Paenibacillus sp. PastH-2]MDH6511110.1 putative small secreted protein [Paenibacillus sp. PastM-3]
MRTRRSTTLIIAVLSCSMVLTSCDAITAQTISSDGSGSGSRMNGGPGFGGGRGTDGGFPGMNGGMRRNGGQGSDRGGGQGGQN